MAGKHKTALARLIISTMRSFIAIGQKARTSKYPKTPQPPYRQPLHTATP